MDYLIGLGLGAIPVAMVAGLLGVATWRDRRRAAAVARQIRLTDAIAGEMGSVVAPVVEKRAFRPWQVRMTVPLGRPALVARILEVTGSTLDGIPGGPYEIVLSGQAMTSWPVPRLAAVVPARRAA